MKTKFASACASLFILSGLGLVEGQSVYGLALPDPLDPNYKNISTYALGDFYSYLLPVLAYQYNPAHTGPGNPYYVDSTPGAIKNLIVIATGANGDGVETNPDFIDNAYDSSTDSKSTTFSTTNTFSGYDTKHDPGIKVNGPSEEGYDVGSNQFSTWDADVSALRTFLGGQKALFMFNHNEENSGSALEQTLYVWGQLVLTSDNPTLNPDIILDLTYNNDLGQTPLPGVKPEDYVNTEGFGYVNDAVTKLDWVTSPGQITILSQTINMNLGANQAAYAAYSPDLQAILDNKSSPYTHLHGLFLMKDIDNGYEQLYLMGGEVGTVIPTPSAAALGMGLLSMLGGFRLIKRRSN